MDILYDRIISGGKHFIKAAGKSTEVPPTKIDGVYLASGSQYAQVDAGILQMFDGVDGEWHNFAVFDTGSSASGSLGSGLGGTLGGGLGGVLGGSNTGTDEPQDGEGE